ncbi:excisionase Xis [Symbiopectobacterium sp. Eva_TO]
MKDNQSWMSTRQVCEFLDMSSRTLERRRKRSFNPFPEPDITCAGSQNKWLRHRVLAISLYTSF